MLGVGTNVDFLRVVLRNEDVVAGRLDTGLLERLDVAAVEVADDAMIAAAAYRWLRNWPDRSADLWDVPTGWRLGEPAPTSVRLHGGPRTDHVHIIGTPHQARVRIEDGEELSLTASLAGESLTVTVDGVRRRYVVAATDRDIWLAGESGTHLIREVQEAPVRQDEEHSGDAELNSPMPGSVVAVGVNDGDQVKAGSVVVAVEAMKMEHSLRSPVDGVVELLVAVGDQVKVGQPLARISVKKVPNE